MTRASRMSLVEGDKASSLIMPVSNLDLQQDNEINYVQYDTVLELDNKPVQIEFSMF